MAEDSATHEAMRRATVGSENLTGQRAPTRALNDRIVELRRVPASELKPHPENWRVRPQAQQQALAGVIEQVGIADAVLAYEPTPGELVLIDGHLRRETLGDTVVPVLVTDLTEAEAMLVLATHDPLAAMAEQDDQMMRDLLERIDAGNTDVQDLLNELKNSTAEWEPNFDLIANTDETDEGILAKLTIRCSPDDVAEIKEVISKALGHFPSVNIV
jgi:hypothetical protein